MDQNTGEDLSDIGDGVSLSPESIGDATDDFALRNPDRYVECTLLVNLFKLVIIFLIYED